MGKLGQSECGYQKKIAERNDEQHKYKLNGATYLVSVHYKGQGGMTVTDKVARLIDKAAQTA